jgi:hypothetical protein
VQYFGGYGLLAALFFVWFHRSILEKSVLMGDGYHFGGAVLKYP